MRDIVIWGASGQAKVLNEALIGTDYRVVALVDNKKMPSLFDGIPILRGEKGLVHWLKRRGKSNDLFCAVAVGGALGSDRLELANLLKEKGLSIITIVHRTAFVAEDVVCGEGCQILANATVSTNSQIGHGVIVNTASSVDHDCVIGNGVHIAPGARLAGDITIGDYVFVGTGAIILPHLKIGKNSIIGAGAVVTKDIPENVTVYGNPARIVKE